MPDDPNIASVVATAITAINKASDLVGKEDSGIDDEQIRQLRKTIDTLELKLNDKKRKLAADRS